MKTVFDAKASKVERDTALKGVLDKREPWSKQVLAAVEALPAGWHGTGEDIRRSWNGDDPSSPNAWGAVIRQAIEKKFLIRTGRRLAMCAKDSHGRQTDEYCRT